MAPPEANNPRAERDRSMVPGGEEIGVFSHYDDARDAVNRLLRGGIPARAVSIVGGDVTMVERIIARFGYGRAAATSAFTGSWIGVVGGLLFVATGTQHGPVALVAGGVIGAGLGMMAGMVLYTTRGSTRPRYRSTQQVIAATYRVLVDPEVGGKAKKLVNNAGGEA